MAPSVVSSSRSKTGNTSSPKVGLKQMTQTVDRTGQLGTQDSRSHSGQSSREHLRGSNSERPAFKTAMASWYDSGSRTADGTKMRLDGDWVATRLVPLGSKIEVRYKGKSRLFTVRDKTHVKTGHRLDFPQKTWQSLTGAKLSKGLVRVEWRKL